MCTGLLPPGANPIAVKIIIIIIIIIIQYKCTVGVVAVQRYAVVHCDIDR